MASMARVQEKAFSSKRSFRNSACVRICALRGLAHHCLIPLALGLDARDGPIERVFAGASRRRLAVEEMQAQHKEQAKRGENGHADAQAL